MQSIAAVTIAVKSEEPKPNHVTKICWEVKEEDWKSKHLLVLPSKTSFPGSLTGRGPSSGVVFGIDRREVGFDTWWPSDVDMDKVETEVKFRFKSNDGLTVLEINPDKCVRWVDKRFEEICHGVSVRRETKSTVNPEKIYDDRRCFIIEAEVRINNAQAGGIKEKLLEDMLSIYQDEKSTDITVVVGDEKLKCHKAIMCARSEVFNKMFTHETREKQTGKVNIEDDVSVEEVEAFIKFVYTGKLPTTTAKMPPTTRLVEGWVTKLFDVDHYFLRGLFHLATKYEVHSLEELCIQKLLDRLDVATCLYTYKIVDKYIPTNVEVREEVKMFMTCKAEEVIECDDWDVLEEDCPALAKVLFKSIDKEVKKKHHCKYCLI